MQPPSGSAGLTADEQATPVHSPDRSIGLRDSVQSSAERPAYDSQARAALGDLYILLDQRYHTPGLPKSACGSRHVDLRNSETALTQNSFGSAEQPAPPGDAALSVPRHSPDLNTGFGQYNPQSGDLVPCHRSKPSPIVFKAPPPKQHYHHPLVASKAPPPNSSLPLEYEGFHNPTFFMDGHRAPPEASDPVPNSQEPILPSKAAPHRVPRRFQLFIRRSPD